MEQALECDVAGHVTHVYIQMYRSIEEKRWFWIELKT